VSISVLSAAASFREALAGFEAGLISGADCALLARELAATEKACAAARLLAAASAVEAGAYREHGFKDGAAWLAQQTGTTGTQARQALETASRLDDCPDTGHNLYRVAEAACSNEATPPTTERLKS
jgi:hypothetical protein